MAAQVFQLLGQGNAGQVLTVAESILLNPLDGIGNANGNKLIRILKHTGADDQNRPAFNGVGDGNAGSRAVVGSDPHTVLVVGIFPDAAGIGLGSQGNEGSDAQEQNEYGT